MMNIESIIEKLNLIPHPEGGYYAETYRSEVEILDLDRKLMTSIYFLLTSKNISKFHRIKSDELWFYHGGSPLYVHTLENGKHIQTKIGINIEQNETPSFLVPKNTIFGSSVVEENSYSLVSCVVAPGFDFRDFELFTYEELIIQFPNESEIIKKLT